MVHHVSEVIITRLIVSMLAREVVLWQFQDDCKQREDLVGNLDRFPREVLYLRPKRLEELVKGLVGILWYKFRNVEFLLVVLDIGAHKRLLVSSLIAEIVAIREVATVFRFVLLFKWLVEEGLCNVVLMVNLVWGQTNIDDAEEACRADLMALFSLIRIVAFVLQHHIQRLVAASLSSACRSAHRIWIGPKQLYLPRVNHASSLQACSIAADSVVPGDK